MENYLQLDQYKDQLAKEISSFSSEKRIEQMKAIRFQFNDANLKFIRDENISTNPSLSIIWMKIVLDRI